MKPEQIDDLLQTYAAAESRISVNLHELAEHPTYIMLKNGALSGATASRLEAALATSDELWALYGRFHDALSRATTLRGPGRRSEHEGELIELLREPSILLSSSSTPLGKRGLLDAPDADLKLTFEQAIDEMRARYEPLRDAVAEVHRVQRQMLPVLDGVAQTLQRARTESEALGVDEPELGRAERRLDEARRLVMDDPLALRADAADELERVARVAAGRIASLRAGRADLQSDMASIAGLIAEIRTLRARAEALGTEATSKIIAPVGIRRVPGPDAIDGPSGLATRAAMVSEAGSGPDGWQRQRYALDQWLSSARRLRDQLFRAVEANRRPLDERDELRGLLTAYRAKQAGVGKAEDLAASEIADEIHNELYTRPTDLARARALLGKLGTAVS